MGLVQIERQAKNPKKNFLSPTFPRSREKLSGIDDSKTGTTQNFLGISAIILSHIQEERAPGSRDALGETLG